MADLVGIRPPISRCKMADQARELLCKPLERITSRRYGPNRQTDPLIIIIDGLDECEDFSGAYGEELFQNLVDSFCKLEGRVKLFFTSRPEIDLYSMTDLVFREASTDCLITHKLHEVDDAHVQQDIRTHFAHALRDIRQRVPHTPRTWPEPEVLDQLAEISRNLFVHATTVVQFIGMRGCSPLAQLDELLGLIGQHVPEDEVSPYKELDRLYLMILHKAGGEKAVTPNSTRSRQFRCILDGVVHSNTPLAVNRLVQDTGVSRPMCLAILDSLSSVLLILNYGDNSQQTVRVFHQSFAEFITDPRRCLDRRFFLGVT